MDLSNWIDIIIHTELGKFLFGQNSLKTGDHLTGKVIEVKPDGKALISFGTFRALAETSVPLKPGETIQVTVEEKGDQLKLRFDQPPNPEIAEKLPVIRRLEIVTDEAWSSLESNKENLNAFLQRVTETEIKFNTDPAIPQAAREFLPQLAAVRQILTQIQSRLESLPLNADPGALAAKIQTFINTSGLFFESRLAEIVTKLSRNPSELPPQEIQDLKVEIRELFSRDLKPNLMQLREFLKADNPVTRMDEPRQLEIVRQTVERLLEQINEQWRSNAEKMDVNLDQPQSQAQIQSQTQTPPQVFSFVLPFKELVHPAKLKIYYKKKGSKGTRREFRVSLLLTFDLLGDLRTDFFLWEQNLNITLYVTDEAIKRLIEDHLPEVKEALAGFFQVLVLKVAVSEKKIKEFEVEDIAMPVTGMIDVKA